MPRECALVAQHNGWQARAGVLACSVHKNGHCKRAPRRSCACGPFVAMNHPHRTDPSPWSADWRSHQGVHLTQLTTPCARYVERRHSEWAELGCLTTSAPFGSVATLARIQVPGCSAWSAAGDHLHKADHGGCSAPSSGTLVYSLGSDAIFSLSTGAPQ